MKDAAQASMETPDISLASSTGAVTNETLDAIPSGADADARSNWVQTRMFHAKPVVTQKSDHFLTISFLDDKDKATTEEFPEKAFVGAMAGSCEHGDDPIREQYCKHHRC
ncbi:uncharacterized protein PADG_07770 [Paracoccidioides brasiliensis Pb18]|uniref:Uncharacterized protein n=1 Tax=Paracoccidioides brasiliensis (strain Pb18) TaxID=502780 RepID=C1GKI4_PARBD|nr:uncharacterized protein PADG_07770 [Paracoccidioides brasiliensis Pb18]EEH42950.2 hypothetical protein PADG_07770 [Paracoccidioides brasiliensis Pb18]